MASTDLATLLDMGFDEPRAKLATQKTGGCMSPPIAHFNNSTCRVENTNSRSARSPRMARKEPGQNY